MDKLLETLKGLQGQVISPDMIQQLQSHLAQQEAAQTRPPHHIKRQVHVRPDEDLHIDGETEMDDLIVAQRIAMMDTAVLEKEKVLASRPQGFIIPKGVDVEFSDSSSDDEVCSTPDIKEARNTLDAIIAKNGFQAIEDDSDLEEDTAVEANFDFSSLPSNLSLHEPLIPVGIVESTVENLLVVQGYQVALDEHSVLCFEDDVNRTVFGMIVETFGVVQHPFYLIAVSNKDLVAKGGELIGSRVCTVPSQSKLILLEEGSHGKFSILGQDRDDQLEWGGDAGSDDEEEAKKPDRRNVEDVSGKAGGYQFITSNLPQQPRSAPQHAPKSINFKWN